MNPNSNLNYRRNENDPRTNEQKVSLMTMPKLSHEEMQILSECGNESFYQRSLPLGSLFGFAAYYLMKSDYLQKSVKYGYVPKIFAAALTGYVLGKLSYRTECENKILLKVPNSFMAKVIRERRTGQTNDGYFSAFDSTAVDPSFNANSFANSSNFVAEREYSHLSDSDEFYKPDFDEKKTYDELPTVVNPNRATTYDELRKQNRDEFYEKYRRGPNDTFIPTQPYQPQPGSGSQPQPGAPSLSFPSNPSSSDRFL